MAKFEKIIIDRFAKKGQTWLANLPNIIQNFTKVWNLKDLTPFTNLSYNYVLSGFQEDLPIVLKLSPDAHELNKEAEALQAFAGHGVIKILDKREGAILLERAVPGQSLKSYLPDKREEALKIIFSLIKKLHQAPLPKDTRIPHIREWFSALDKDCNVPAHYLQKARFLKRPLLATITETVLLHGDLHHDNILLNSKDWIAIDPKGIIGSPINEIWTVIVDIEKDTQLTADVFDLDVKLVRQWYFLHLILTACCNITNNMPPNRFLDLAQEAYPLTET